MTDNQETLDDLRRQVTKIIESEHPGSQIQIFTDWIYRLETEHLHSAHEAAKVHQSAAPRWQRWTPDAGWPDGQLVWWRWRSSPVFIPGALFKNELKFRGEHGPRFYTDYPGATILRRIDAPDDGTPPRPGDTGVDG